MQVLAFYNEITAEFPQHNDGKGTSNILSDLFFLFGNYGVFKRKKKHSPQISTCH